MVAMSAAHGSCARVRVRAVALLLLLAVARASTTLPVLDAREGGASGEVVEMLQEDASQSVLSAAVSLEVPLGNPALALRLSLDGKSLASEAARTVTGSASAELQVSVLDLFDVRAGIKGGVTLLSRVHDDVGSMLVDFGRFLASRALPEVHGEAEHVMDSLRAAVQRAEEHALQVAHESLLTVMADAVKSVDGQLARVAANGRSEAWAAAASLLGADLLTRGTWEDAHLVPVLYKIEAVGALAGPWLMCTETFSTDLLAALGTHGFPVHEWERRERAAAEATGAGHVTVFVTDVLHTPGSSEAGKVALRHAVPTYVRVRSDVDEATTAVRVESEPVFLESVRVAVADAHAPGAHIKVEVVRGDDVVRSVNVLLTGMLEPNKHNPIDDGAGRHTPGAFVPRGSVLWQPLRADDVFALVGVPDETGLMRVHMEGARETLFLRRSGPGGWTWGRTPALMYSVHDPEQKRGSVMGDLLTADLSPDERVLCAYLAAANPPVLSDADHVSTLLRRMILDDVGRSVARVEPIVAPYVQALRSVLGRAMRNAQRDRAVISDYDHERVTREVAQLRAQLAALVADGPALQATARTLLKAKADDFLALLDRAKLQLAAAGESSVGGGDERRAMTVDLNYVLTVGATGSVRDATLTAVGGVAGRGVRGEVHGGRVLDSVPLRTYDVHTFSGSVEAGGAKLALSGTHKVHGDGSVEAVLLCEVTMPFDETALAITNAVPGARRSFLHTHHKLLRALETVLAGSASDVSTLAFTTILGGLEAAAAELAPSLATHRLDSVYAHKLVPGAVLKLFFHAPDRASALTQRTGSMQVIGYVMDKASLNLERALGGAVPLKASGSVEAGLWWRVDEL